jgi:hypothetical protein
MRKFKNIENGYIVALSTGCGQVEISDAEYNELLFIIHSKPTDPEGYVYMLLADTLEWELVELPPEPEPDEPGAEEIIDYLFGGDTE